MIGTQTSDKIKEHTKCWRVIQASNEEINRRILCFKVTANQITNVYNN